MTGKVWLLAAFLTASLLVSACGGETMETPATTPDEASIPVQPSTPIPTAELESVVRRVLAEARAAEPPPETPEPAPIIDAEALAFEVTERVLATLEARGTPTPEPTPEPTPTPTPTPEPTPSLPEVARSVQKSLLRITGAGGNGELLTTGVVVGVDDSTGEVFALTKHQQVANAGMLEASRTDGAKYEASIIGADEKRDVALLRLCCDASAVTMPFGDALTLPVGSELVALEFGFQPGAGIVVSRGVLSSVRFDAERERWIIQTDAAASGETGGVLVTPDGRLIGLITGRAGGFANAISEVTLSEVLIALR